MKTSIKILSLLGVFALASFSGFAQQDKDEQIQDQKSKLHVQQVQQQQQQQQQQVQHQLLPYSSHMRHLGLDF